MLSALVQFAQAFDATSRANYMQSCRVLTLSESAVRWKADAGQQGANRYIESAERPVRMPRSENSTPPGLCPSLYVPCLTLNKQEPDKRQQQEEQ